MNVDFFIDNNFQIFQIFSTFKPWFMASDKILQTKYYQLNKQNII